ncbi:glycerol-3-phosphate 1-O-acyltransferase PlsY [Youxingia wuxianensis]|uniref:Glycerol-3-phosphate acyltransferase n=1 Tax=Youxingia wuxianensis TaxID=2763678 RepID=A0A926EQ79_9FIRM|nr:glycerol-3-phosphate 1-O-acyltransferase PlsY [Youxingia wuxianensis]MBC8585741.1 glycerol-3-phosphate 1-O-acyltransferase PlsY [Youxingia wuxianensis]
MQLTADFLGMSALVAIISYLIGSVSFAVIISRTFEKEDIRNFGSGNAGMTNILRNYGKKLAVLTAVGDFGKALVAVALGRLLYQMAGITQSDGGYIAGLCVILGHLYPVFFKFKGGKGVLTSLGVILILNPWVFLMLVVLLLPFVLIVKIVSLTVLIGYILFPIFTYFVSRAQGAPVVSNVIFALMISAMGAYAHRENIQRLRNGTEYRFGEKK